MHWSDLVTLHTQEELSAPGEKSEGFGKSSAQSLSNQRVIVAGRKELQTLELSAEFKGHYATHPHS